MKKDKTKILFLTLLEGIGDIYEGGMRTYRGYHRLPKQEIDYINERKEYLQLKQAERRKRIKLKKDGEDILYRFTKNGLVYALKTKIITCEVNLPIGEVCIVVFDIPEEIKRVRSVLRSLLKRAGFYMVQKSVWEIDKEVVDDFRLLTKLLEVDKYVKVYRALEVR